MKEVLAGRAGARLLEVRIVDVVSGRGASVTLSSVRCPVRGRSAAVEACADCGGRGAIAQDALSRGEFLSCGGPREHRRSRPEIERATPAATVGAAMRRSAVALRATLSRSVAADALRARGVPAAPVVDGDGRPVGMVTESDLLRARAGARVADAMTRVALSVPEGAAIVRAASLMAGHGLDRLAVVASDGVLVGVLTSGDVVAWLAGDDGSPPRPG
ncbi:MAG TPA: CBS domain-containing protein [Anaeromyxobacter sp.]